MQSPQEVQSLNYTYTLLIFASFELYIHITPKMCAYDFLLSQAATDGDAETLRELVFTFGEVPVSHDSLINMYNTLGYTMLHYAIMYKRMDCITTLIELGAGMFNELS